MKLFIYKSLIIFFLITIVFKLTVGSLIKNFDERKDIFLSKESISQIKEKVRDEMRSAIEKKNYLEPDDARLLGQFLEKLKQEVTNQK